MSWYPYGAGKRSQKDFSGIGDLNCKRADCAKFSIIKVDEQRGLPDSSYKYALWDKYKTNQFKCPYCEAFGMYASNNEHIHKFNLIFKNIRITRNHQTKDINTGEIVNQEVEHKLELRVDRQSFFTEKLLKRHWSNFDLHMPSEKIDLEVIDRGYAFIKCVENYLSNNDVILMTKWGAYYRDHLITETKLKELKLKYITLDDLSIKYGYWDIITNYRSAKSKSEAA